MIGELSIQDDTKVPYHLIDINGQNEKQSSPKPQEATGSLRGREISYPAIACALCCCASLSITPIVLGNFLWKNCSGPRDVRPSYCNKGFDLDQLGLAMMSFGIVVLFFQCVFISNSIRGR